MKGAIRAVVVSLLLLGIGVPAAQARGKLQGYIEQGGKKVSTAGAESSDRFQRSYNGGRVNVYLAGTVTLATIYSDLAGTSKANPFTADSTGHWNFYADDGCYDVKFDGSAVPVPYTWGDMCIVGSSAVDGTLDTINIEKYANPSDVPVLCDGTTTLLSTQYGTLAAAQVFYPSAAALTDELDWAVLQSAITSLTSGGSIYIPQGTCLVNKTVSMTPNADMKVFGEGMKKSIVKANAAMTGVFSWPSDAGQLWYDIRDLGVDGASLAQYGFYAPKVGSFGLAHSTWFRVRVIGTTTYAWSIAYGWNNDWLECEASNNSGGGFELPDNNNGNNLVNTKIFLNSGLGLYTAASFGIRLAGCTFETNKKGGIYSLNSTTLTIDGNYFESNAQDGFAFTTDYTETVKSDIIINGSSLSTRMSAAFPSEAVSITNNATSNAYAAEFVLLIGVKGAVIENNTTNDSASGYSTYYLLRAVQNSALGGSASGFNYNVRIGRNTLFAKWVNISNILTTNAHVDGLRSWDDSTQIYRNYALDIRDWSLFSASGGGTFTRSTTKYNKLPMFLLTGGAGTSDIYTFVLDIADYPDLAGKPLLWGGWSIFGTTETVETDWYTNCAGDGTCTGSSSGGGGSKTAGTIYFDGNILIAPTTGTIRLGIRRLTGGGTISFFPLLIPVGVSEERIRELGPTTPRIELVSATWDPPSTANNAMSSTALAVTSAGLAQGDICFANHSLNNTANGITFTCAVRGTDSVGITLINNSGGVIDLASGTVLISVIRER